MKALRLALVVVAICLFVPATANAQPALPLASQCNRDVLGFDYSRQITLTGTSRTAVRVIGADATSCEMSMSVNTDQGNWEWLIVLFAPAGTPALAPYHVTPGAFSIGTPVEVTGYVTAVRPLGPHQVIYMLPTSIRYVGPMANR